MLHNTFRYRYCPVVLPDSTYVCVLPRFLPPLRFAVAFHRRWDTPVLPTLLHSIRAQHTRTTGTTGAHGCRRAWPSVSCAPRLCSSAFHFLCRGATPAATAAFTFPGSRLPTTTRNRWVRSLLLHHAAAYCRCQAFAAFAAGPNHPPTNSTCLRMHFVWFDATRLVATRYPLCRCKISDCRCLRRYISPTRGASTAIISCPALTLYPVTTALAPAVLLARFPYAGRREAAGIRRRLHHTVRSRFYRLRHLLRFYRHNISATAPSRAMDLNRGAVGVPYAYPFNSHRSPSPPYTTYLMPRHDALLVCLFTLPLYLQAGSVMQPPTGLTHCGYTCHLLCVLLDAIRHSRVASTRLPHQRGWFAT